GLPSAHRVATAGPVVAGGVIASPASRHVVAAGAGCPAVRYRPRAELVLAARHRSAPCIHRGPHRPRGGARVGTTRARRGCGDGLVARLGHRGIARGTAADRGGQPARDANLRTWAVSHDQERAPGEVGADVKAPTPASRPGALGVNAAMVSLLVAD